LRSDDLADRLAAFLRSCLVRSPLSGVDLAAGPLPGGFDMNRVCRISA